LEDCQMMPLCIILVEDDQSSELCMDFGVVNVDYLL